METNFSIEAQALLSKSIVKLEVSRSKLVLLSLNIARLRNYLQDHSNHRYISQN